MFKFQKINNKESIWKEDGGKKLFTNRGAKIRIISNFSSETTQARRKWSEIFKVLIEKNHQPRIMYPGNFSFISEGEIKNFSDKQKLGEFVASKPVL